MLERRTGAVQMGTQQRRVERRRRARIVPQLAPTGCRRLGRVGKSDRLVPERRENFLVPQQPLAVGLDHEYGFSGSATHRAGCLLPRQELNVRDSWEPDIESRARSGRALHIHGPLVIQDDFANRCETETVSFGTRREKWLEDPFDQPLLHAAPPIPDRNDDIAAGYEFALAHRQYPSALPPVDVDPDRARRVHRLSCIVANIQNDLLELRRLPGDGRLP